MARRVLDCGDVDLGDKNKYIIDGHGCLDNTTFEIPEGYYFITLSPVGQSIRLGPGELHEISRALNGIPTMNEFLEWARREQRRADHERDDWIRCHKPGNMMNNHQLILGDVGYHGRIWKVGDDGEPVEDDRFSHLEGKRVSLKTCVEDGTFPQGVYALHICRTPCSGPIPLARAVSHEHNEGGTGVGAVKRARRTERRARRTAERTARAARDEEIIADARRLGPAGIFELIHRGRYPVYSLQLVIGRTDILDHVINELIRARIITLAEVRALKDGGRGGGGGGGAGAGAAGTGGRKKKRTTKKRKVNKKKTTKRKTTRKRKTPTKRKSKARMTKQKRKVNGVTRNVRISSTGRKYVLLKGKRHFL